MLNAVGIELRVGYLEVDDRIYLHGDVILGDNGLRREVCDLLLERNGLCDLLKEGDLDMDAGTPGGLILAKTLDDHNSALLYDSYVACNDNQHKSDERNCDPTAVGQKVHKSVHKFPP